MKLPQWAQNAMREEHDFDPEGEVGAIIYQLQQYPENAYLENLGYADYPEYKVTWYRDMTEKEYERAKAKRKKEREKKAEEKARIEELQYMQYLDLKKKFETQ